MLRVKAVAERLSLSLSAVYALIESCALPHYKIGGAIRVSEEQLRTFLEEREQRPAPAKKTGPRPALKHIRL